MDQPIPLHQHFHNIKERAKQSDMTLREILDQLGTDGHYTAVIFLIAPFLQPVPLLGLSSFVGPVIALLAFFSYSGKTPWIPHKWNHKKISGHTLIKISEFGEKISKKISRLVHERWAFFLSEPFRILGICLTIINALLFALPLPVPMSNSIPAWAIFFWALSYLENDGLFAFLSYITTSICFAFFILIALGAEAGIVKIFT